MVDARKYCVVVALACAPALATPEFALAQEAAGAPISTAGVGANPADSSDYDRGHNVSVQDTPRPSYEALGIRAGGFMVYPRVSLTADYDDNIFSAPVAAGDFIVDVAPQVEIQSNWSRNALSAYLRLDQNAYARYSSQDSTQYGAGLTGKLQFGTASNMTGGLDYGHFILPRSISNNFGQSLAPVSYDYTALNDQIDLQFNRIRMSFRFDDQDYQFHDGATATGAVVSLAGQSHNDEIVTGRFEYALTPDAAVDFEAQGNHRGYGSGSATFSSSGYQLNAGANFDITHLLRGEVSVGYLSENFVSAAFKPVQGLSGHMRIEWFPTRLTTVSLEASREVGPSQVAGSAGYVGSSVRADINHALLRNLILAGNFSIAHNDNVGIDRSDTIIGAGASASWLISRHFGLKFAYAYTDQRSSRNAAGNSFTDNRGTLALVLQL